jgi:hypothetical protein
MRKSKPRRSEQGTSSARKALREPRVDRTRISVTTLNAPADYVAYWQSRSPDERLAHMEFLRLINYGEAAVSGRLKRVLEIAQLRLS